LEDLVERINRQYAVLMDDVVMRGGAPQELLGDASSAPQKDSMVMAGTTDRSSTDRRSGEVKSPLLEVHGDVSRADGPSLLEVRGDVNRADGPSLLEVHGDVNRAEEHTRCEQKVTKAAEGLQNNKVLLGGRRNSGNQSVLEEVIYSPVEREIYRDHEGNGESNAVIVRAGSKRCRKHGKEKFGNKVVREQNLVSEIDRTDGGEIDITRKDDSLSVLSEYSFDISVSKTTREHSMELSSETSSSTSYEGVKVVVSVSELTQKYQSTSPRGGAVISHGNSPQAAENHRIVGGKTGKWKHKQRGTCNRSVNEKATMTAEDEVYVSDKGNLKTDLMIERSESKTKEDKYMTSDGTRQRQDVICTSAARDKTLSEGSTSYLSLPDQLVASNIQDLEQLLAAWHDYQTTGVSEAFRTDPWLAGYILRLLAMSRESVHDLHVSTSDVSTPDIDVSATDGTDHKTLHETVKQSTQESTEMKQTTENKTYSDQRPEVRTVTRVGNAVQGKREGMTGDVPVSHRAVTDSRQACHVASVPQVTGPHYYSEFRHVDTKTQSTLTPQQMRDSREITDTELCEKMVGLEGFAKKRGIIQEQLHSSCRCGDDSCERDMQTPLFDSAISDMSLDEYKRLKFPEIFSNYSEKCSERISHLTQRIEQIRGEKQKFIELSGSCSSSASSSSASSSGASSSGASSSSASSNSASSNISGFDSTKYFSPPEMSVVMSQLPNRDKGPVRVQGSDQEAGGDVPCVHGAGNQRQMSQKNQLPKCTSFLRPSDGNEAGVRRQHSRCYRNRARPPPCLRRYKLQRLVLLHFSPLCLPLFRRET
jgi:hypothetical protein